jgi:hypothetical protein
VSLPFVTIKILVAIHWEALRLWLKGTKFILRRSESAPETGLAIHRGSAYNINVMPGGETTSRPQEDNALVRWDGGCG